MKSSDDGFKRLTIISTIKRNNSAGVKSLPIKKEKAAICYDTCVQKDLNEYLSNQMLNKKLKIRTKKDQYIVKKGPLTVL